MSDLCVGMALFLLVNLGLGLLRILRGPAPADRMMAAQLFGTTGVAVLLLLSRGLDEPAFFKAALVIALLSGVAVIAFIKCIGIRDEKAGGKADGTD